MQANGVPYRIITDHLGSVRLVVDANGAVAQRIDYDACGRVLTNTNPGFFVDRARVKFALSVSEISTSQPESIRSIWPRSNAGDQWAEGAPNFYWPENPWFP